MKIDLLCICEGESKCGGTPADGDVAAQQKVPRESTSSTAADAQTALSRLHASVLSESSQKEQASTAAPVQWSPRQQPQQPPQQLQPPPHLSQEYPQQQPPMSQPPLSMLWQDGASSSGISGGKVKTTSVKQQGYQPPLPTGVSGGSVTGAARRSVFDQVSGAHNDGAHHLLVAATDPGSWGRGQSQVQPQPQMMRGPMGVQHGSTGQLQMLPGGGGQLDGLQHHRDGVAGYHGHASTLQPRQTQPQKLQRLPPRRTPVGAVSRIPPYAALLLRLQLLCERHPLTTAILLENFLRDELRSLLKANNVSYHRGGPQNMMKSKAEMASNLIELLNADAGLSAGQQSLTFVATHSV